MNAKSCTVHSYNLSFALCKNKKTPDIMPLTTAKLSGDLNKLNNNITLELLQEEPKHMICCSVFS